MYTTNETEQDKIRPSYCTWTGNSIEKYKTECGNVDFMKPPQWKYCHFCGGKIKLCNTPYKGFN